MRLKIYVVPHGYQWKVTCEHCAPGQHEAYASTQHEAMAIAWRHVGELPAGTLSQILISGQDGRYRAEWTYGNDPYPPAG